MATSAVAYTGTPQRKTTCALLKALEGKQEQDFIASLGPLGLGVGAHNNFYPDEKSHMMAAAEVMHEEYRTLPGGKTLVPGVVGHADLVEHPSSWPTRSCGSRPWSEKRTCRPEPTMASARASATPRSCGPS